MRELRRLRPRRLRRRSAKRFLKAYEPQPLREWRITRRRVAAAAPYLLLVLLFVTAFIHPAGFPLAVRHLTGVYVAQMLTMFVFLSLERTYQHPLLAIFPDTQYPIGRTWWIAILVVGMTVLFSCLFGCYWFPLVPLLLVALPFFAIRISTPVAEYDHAHTRRSTASILLFLLANLLMTLPCCLNTSWFDDYLAIAVLAYYLLFGASELIGHAWVSGNGRWGGE